MEHQFSIIKAFENFAELGAEWVMWLMVILGFVLIVLTIERLVLFLRTRVDAPQIARELITLLNQGKIEEAKTTLTQGISMEQRVIADGLEVYHQGAVFVEQMMMSALAREKQRFNRYLSYFGTLGNNTPFIGLFGTVIGIIIAFKQLGANPKGGLEVIGPAISEALVATAVGLLVAIPAVVLFNLFKSMLKVRLGNTDYLMRIILAYLHDQTQSTKDELDFQPTQVEKVSFDPLNLPPSSDSSSGSSSDSSFASAPSKGDS